MGAFIGEKKTNPKEVKVCSDCNGTGYNPEKERQCATCDGSGK